jgi:succinoglycan biosynthesis protein ExoM
MNQASRDIDICVCTYRRPALLERLLTELRHIEIHGSLACHVIVADNDEHESAREVVAAFRGEAAFDIRYCVESTRNIALARNRVLAETSSDLIALIDDDEFPTSPWLRLLVSTLDAEGADGVLGPVLPHYSVETPDWFRKAGLYSFRKRYHTRTRLSWRECRTGNALVKREVFTSMPGPFREEFGTGGEDQDFFRRAMERGRTFVWCDEAVVYEMVQPSRWKRRVLFSRALLRGKDTFRHQEHRTRVLAKAIVAVPLYCSLLPLFLVLGQHRFMKLITKLAAHLGVLLAAVGLNPVQQRHN